MGRLFEAVNDRVDAFSSSAGAGAQRSQPKANRMPQTVGADFSVFVDYMRHFDQRGELRGSSGFHPVPEELKFLGNGSVFPKPAEVDLQCSRGAGLHIVAQLAALFRCGPLAQIFPLLPPEIFDVN
jgi:hypothetical protein